MSGKTVGLRKGEGWKEWKGRNGDEESVNKMEMVARMKKCLMKKS